MQHKGKPYRTILFIGIFLVPFCLYPQKFDIAAGFESEVMVLNRKKNPFWFHTNSNFSIGEFTHFTATAKVMASLSFSDFRIHGGAVIFARDGVENNIQRRDLYLQFENSWMLATLGAKKPKEVLDGLSATNQDFLMSGNARPMPGVLLEANNPFRISNTFSVQWAIAHYEMNDNRFVEGVNLHYKSFGLNVKFNETNKLTAEIQHYAQWGGTSPELGELKNGFKDFVNVFFAHTAPEYDIEGETLNKIGNHLGTYLLQYELYHTLGEFSVYYNHYIEDGSGTRLANFPDGVWGIYFKPRNSGVFSAILYEYIDTVDQSGISVGSGKDNYFSNSIYRNGWTYENNIVGMPFMIFDKEAATHGVSPYFISTRSRVHHVGITGEFNGIHWKLKSSRAKYLGTYARPLTPEWMYWYNYASLSYKIETLGTFTIRGGIDFSNRENTVVGGGLKYCHTF